MTLYTFHICDAHGFSACFDARELNFDSAAYPIAGDLLMQHPSAAYVAVWDEDRPVLERHREKPVFRAANENPASSAA